MSVSFVETMVEESWVDGEGMNVGVLESTIVV
jgi:hypothetical protein